MVHKFLDLASTDAVRAAQKKYFGRAQRLAPASDRDSMGADEADFVRARDSFYMASVSETGWPYIQHRGGKPGFLRVLDSNSLGFADYKGNRQLISTGNLSINGRVALFLMDYPGRSRLKILGHARILDARENPEQLALLAGPEERQSVERLFLIDVVAFDWNCPQHITPRYGAEEVQELVTPLQHRIAELEALLRSERER